jgi:hypothetical protein
MEFNNKLKPAERKKAIKEITALVNRDWQPDAKANPKMVLKSKGKKYYQNWLKENKGK